MIKFENTEVFNFEGALRGMRNPLNSWNKSDSFYGCRIDENDNVLHKEKYPIGYITKCEECGWCERLCEDAYSGKDKIAYIIGPKDLDLAQRLIKAGTDHRKFLRQIMVSVDIIAPLYWWKEFDTYKVGTVANSCSTMHKIHAEEFTIKDFSTEHLNEPCLRLLNKTIEYLNAYRETYIDSKNKEDWWQLIQLLPSSYNQKRTVTLNYEVIANIYKSRKYHKLDEWSVDFINWIESLPYANELIIGE